VVGLTFVERCSLADHRAALWDQDPHILPTATPHQPASTVS
jgi:hypothetical protein